MSRTTVINEKFPGPAADDPRPMVAIRRTDRSMWWFVGIATMAAILLLVALDSRRRAATADDVAPASGVGVRAESVPDLSLPEPIDAVRPVAAASPWALPYGRPAPPATGIARIPGPAPVTSRASQSSSPPPYIPPYVPPPTALPEPPPPALPLERTAGSSGGAPNADRRITASRLASPSTTVPQGTLVSAVLETALDSTGPGQVRAMVTRDVFGFDGTQLLIPRGSKLYGTYDASISQGQKRAQIRWTRLMRPDAVTIALDSPASDPLGRAGVQGRVNNHFFQRFGNALLSSTMNFGSTLATRQVSPVIVAVPGGAQQAGPVVPNGADQIRPTLTVRQGARVSVFVQHDLDFSDVDATKP